MAIYAKITGAKQGDIKGGVTAKSFDGQIQINQLEFGVGNPTDVSSGLATGKRVPRPVHITKPLDQSSPLLHTSCTDHESLTVKFSYVKEGEGHKATVTLSLTNAMIKDFNHDASFDGTAVERLSLTYTKIEFTWVDGGIVSTDDWTSST